MGGDGTLILKVLIEYLSAQGLNTYISAVENLALTNGEISISDFSILAQYWWFGENVTKQCTCPTGSYTLYNCNDTLHNTKCAVCSQCNPDQYEATQCTRSSDSVCNTCGVCDPGFFVSKSCSKYSDVKCTQCTVCGVGKYVLTPCSNDIDSTCDESSPSEVVFTILMPQSKLQFGIDQDAYIVSMGETLFKEEAMASSPQYDSWTKAEKFIYYNKSVHITSVQDVALRRRLLAVGPACDVGTSVSVGGIIAAADVVNQVSAGDFVSELSTNLELNGLPAAYSVSEPSVVMINTLTTAPAAPPTEAPPSSNLYPTSTVVGSAVGAVVFLGLVGVLCVLVFRKRAGVSNVENKDLKGASMDARTKAEMVLLGVEEKIKGSDGTQFTEIDVEENIHRSNSVQALNCETPAVNKRNEESAVIRGGFIADTQIVESADLLTNQQIDSEAIHWNVDMDTTTATDTPWDDIWQGLMCTHHSVNGKQHEEEDWLHKLKATTDLFTSTISSLYQSSIAQHKGR